MALQVVETWNCVFIFHKKNGFFRTSGFCLRKTICISV